MLKQILKIKGIKELERKSKKTLNGGSGQTTCEQLGTVCCLKNKDYVITCGTGVCCNDGTCLFSPQIFN